MEVIETERRALDDDLAVGDIRDGLQKAGEMIIKVFPECHFRKVGVLCRRGAANSFR